MLTIFTTIKSSQALGGESRPLTKTGTEGPASLILIEFSDSSCKYIYMNITTVKRIIPLR